jgi:hypothetical protein
VFALAWSTPIGYAEWWIEYYKNLSKQQSGNQSSKEEMFPVRLPPCSSTYILITGRQVNVPEDRIIWVSEEEFLPLRQLGARRVD